MVKFVLMLLSAWWMLNTSEDIHGLTAGKEKDSFFITGKNGKICRLKANFKQHSFVEKCQSLSDRLITSVSFFENKGIAVGEGGSIFVSDDGGMDWQKVSSPTSFHLLDIEVLSEKDAIAVGDWGTVLVSHDGGITWKEIPLEKKFKGIFIGEPILTRDLKDPKTGKIYKKGEALSYLELKKLYGENLDIFIRDDVILNDIERISKDKVLVAGERGRLFLFDKSGELLKESRVFPEDPSQITIPDLTGEESLFFIAYNGRDFWTGGSLGLLVNFRLSKLEHLKNIKFIDYLRDAQETVFSGDIKAKTLCIAGSDGLLLYSFDGGESFNRIKAKNLVIRWFRKTISPEEGICIYGGEKGLLLEVTK